MVKEEEALVGLWCVHVHFFFFFLGQTTLLSYYCSNCTFRDNKILWKHSMLTLLLHAELA